MSPDRFLLFAVAGTSFLMLIGFGWELDSVKRRLAELEKEKVHKK